MVGITIVQAKFAIERDPNSSVVRESLYCDPGIIKFGKSPTAFCKQSGLH